LGLVLHETVAALDDAILLHAVVRLLGPFSPQIAEFSRIAANVLRIAKEKDCAHHK
jgi:hypothetical protein